MATLPEERTGAGSALLMAIRQVAGALGIALLGSLLNAVYVRELDPDLAALPERAGDPARDSIAGAAQVAAPRR